MAAHKSRMTYDDVVATLPHLDPEEQVNLLHILSAALKKAIAPHKARRHSLTELEGLGAEIWTKVKVEDYIRRERDSWD